MAKIQIKNLTKAYQNNYVIKNTDFEIASGDFVVILGESGCGKSTLLKIIAGLIPFNYGEIYFDDVLVNFTPAAARDVMMVFQETVLYPNYTVYENIGFYLKHQKYPALEIDKIVRKAAESFNLTECLNQLPRFLSGGQLQRVALAKAVARNPAILLFDEPLSNIDEQSKKTYLKYLINLKEELPKTTFIYVTHQHQEAFLLSKKIALMSEGKIIQITPSFELLTNFENIEALNIISASSNKLEPITFTQALISQDEYLYQTFDLNYLNKEGYFLPNPLKTKTYSAFKLTGESLSGLRQTFEFRGYLGLKTLKLFEEINLPEEFLNKLIMRKLPVNVLFQSNKFHFNKYPTDLTIKGKINYLTNNIISIEIKPLNKTRIVLYLKNHKYQLNQEINLYYPINDLILTTLDGMKIKANYQIYPNISSKRGLIKITDFSYSPKKATNALQIKKVINEDYISSNQKLIYFYHPEFKNYVTALIPANSNVLKPFYLIIHNISEKSI